MKYELIAPVNPDYDTTTQILINRGIDKGEINHYLNTTDEDINSPLLFGENLLRAAATELIKTIKENNHAFILIDSDCDGFTSSAILINYLYNLFPSWVENKLEYYIHSGKQHGLSDCISEISEKNKLIIIPDAGSNDVKECQCLKNRGCSIIILDHHECDVQNPFAIVINNQLSNYPNKNLSGAGVTWQFCKYVDSLMNTDYADNYLDLVALGLDADMMSLTSIETKHLILKGLKQVKNPFIAYMVEKNSYSLKGKLTPIGVAFYIAPFVNAIVRSGTQEEKELIFLSMLNHKAFKILPSTKRGHQPGEEEKLVEQAVRVATNVKARQTKAQDLGMEKLEHLIEENNMLSHKVLLFLLEPGEIDKNIAGLIANKIMAKYQRPVCILTKSEVIMSNSQYQETFHDTIPFDITSIRVIAYQGSARGCEKTGITNFKDICTQTDEIIFATGHQSAFGLGLYEDNIENFIEKTDDVLRNITDEAKYYVDYIFKTTIPPDTITSICDLNDLWGKDFDEPYVVIENLKVSSDMVTIYRKAKNTIKIHLKNNVDLMIFNASDLECDKLQTNNTGYVEINLVGTCNINEWMGIITPQIFITDYEIIDSNKYYF